MAHSIGKLHIITDTVLQSRFTHIDLARLAMKGGADTIQFRQKIGSTGEMIHQCTGIKEACRLADVPFIVNDRLDVAMAVNADGVHLGQEDFPLPLARRFFEPNKIFGGSAATLEEAVICEREGADYIGFGPIFPTASKEDAGPASGLSLLAQVIQSVSIPIIAIGGITPENAPEVMRAGAAGIAVISAVCCAPDPEAATRRLSQSLRQE